MPVLQDHVLGGVASVGLGSTNFSRNDPMGYTGGFGEILKNAVALPEFLNMAIKMSVRQ